MPRLPVVSLALAAVLALAALPAVAQAPARERAWRLALGGGFYQVDDLVGTPLVPAASLTRTLGRNGFVGLEITGIFNQGFYSLNALAGDLDLGVRFPMDPFELSLSAGPSGILGGDSDGTPYTGGGVHGAVGATAWVTNSVGLQARGRVRYWWGVANEALAGLSLGLVVKL